MMVQNISFMGSASSVRTLLSTHNRPGQCVNEYITKEGQKMTEIITDLGEGKTGIREIYKDATGIPNRVIDKVCGRHEVYTYNNRKGVVQQEAEEGIMTELPANYWHYLTKI